MRLETFSSDSALLKLNSICLCAPKGGKLRIKWNQLGEARLRSVEAISHTLDIMHCPPMHCTEGQPIPSGSAGFSELEIVSEYLWAITLF